MKKLFLLFGLLLSAFLLFGCITGGEPSENPANENLSIGVNKSDSVSYTYYSSPLFMIYYPRGWKVDDSVQGTFRFGSPKEDADDIIIDEFIVEIWEGSESTPAEFEEYEKTLMVEGDAVTNREETVFNGRNAFVIEVDGSEPKSSTPMLFKTVFFRNGKWVYRLNYGMEKSKKDKYEPVMESILDQFIVGSYGT
ncbi:hypothetical protein HY992_04230 [Candidatus Micrarchaeota archaeon]|nr:hypothetical protein [Candidatus Micrarchaeota archaeon]